MGELIGLSPTFLYWYAGFVSKPLRVLSEVIESLMDICNDSGRGSLGWLVPRGVLLCGPPGVGKTHSVRQTAALLAPRIEVSRYLYKWGRDMRALLCLFWCVESLYWHGR